MSIFKRLMGSVTPATSQDTIPTPGSGTLFYEHIPIPEGPGMNQLNRILTILPPLDLKSGPWLAGGAPRRLLQGKALDSENGDVDLFFDSFGDWDQFDKILQNFESVHKSTRASTYLVEGVKVQVIRRKFYKTLSDVFKDFDFSACQIATDGRQLALTNQAHKDISSDTLRLAPQGTVSKHTVVGRMVKYVNHGFIPEPGLFKLIVDSGLDMVSAYRIFDREMIESVSSGDHDGKVEDEMDTRAMNAGVMRTIAHRLGLEREDG